MRTLVAMQIAFSLTEVVGIVQPIAVKGSTSVTLRSIAALDAAVSGDITFLGNPRYRPQVATSKGSVILLPTDFVGEPLPDQVFLLVANPSAALAKLSARVEQSLWPKPSAGVHPSAIVSNEATVAASATVGPLCIIEGGAVVGERCHLEARVHLGRNARVGDDTILKSGVTISNECEVGRRVIIHPGAVIGSDGFGYEFVNGRHEKVPQIGIVVVEDDVEIGANTAVDRARFNRTVVGQGTKIDNLVQIGHNVLIGKHCIICGQVALAGSATLEDYVVLGGQVAIAGHITIGKGSRVGGQAGVHASLPPGSCVTGTPPLPLQKDRRVNVLRERLPELFKRVKALEESAGKASTVDPA